jgi:serine/threonine protein kinase
MNETLPIGSTLDGERFTIKSTLGKGGFSITYLAENRLGKQFTIKEFFIDQFSKRENNSSVSFGDLPDDKLNALKNKFEKEGRLLIKIESEKHRHIVKAVDLFSENNTHYLVLEYIDGRTLDEVIKKGGPLKISEAANWLRQVGIALSGLHHDKIYHLDVKPSNIIIDNEGKAVLIDFGLCKEIKKKVDNELTTLAYSNGYAAPEQEDGTGQPNAQMDIYSFVATCFFILTGKKPDSVNKNNYDFFSANESDLKNAIKKGLSLNPIQRQSSMYELLQELKLVNEEEKTVLKIPHSATKINKSKKPKLNPALLVLPLLLVALFFGYKYSIGDNDNDSERMGAPANDTAQGSQDDKRKEDNEVKKENIDDRKNSDPEISNNEVTPNKNSVNPTETKPKNSFRYKGKIHKSRDESQYLTVHLEYIFLNKKNEYGENMIAGKCTITDPKNKNTNVTMDVSGYVAQKDGNENLKLNITSKNGDNSIFCDFSGDFFYKQGTKKITTHFSYKTGTATGNACSAFRTNSDLTLEKT